MQQNTLTQKKNTFTLPYNSTILTFTGAFDSGNLGSAVINHQSNEIELQFGKDRDVKPSAKCWFYFSISGEYQYMVIKMNLLKVNSLNIVAKVYDLYRPVVRIQGGDWERHGMPVEFQIGADGDISFRMSLEVFGSKRFQVALCYPWTLADDERYFSNLQKSLSKRKDIYFNRQTLIYSPQSTKFNNKDNPVHLVALSSGQVANNEPEQYIEHCFPHRQTEGHYKMIKKPLILVTCRVHPGQIGSSYSMMGMIDFLVSNNVEARKILNEFYFLFVPILNPDGVFNGNNRMDSLGQNLNRFYLLPDLEKQPSCFAVKSLLEHTRMSVYAFFDLHGHANKKSCFLFGNSINNQRLQVESILFAKYLSTVCEYIEFKSCNFSKKQMSSKDKNDDQSKQGCARVVVHKWTNSPYCYTLQTGLYKNVRVDDKGIERYGQQFYGPKIYGQVGSKMLISLYAILKKDKQIEQMRKQVVQYVIKLQKTNAKKQLKPSDKNSKKQIGTTTKIKQKKQSIKQIENSLQGLKIGGWNEKQNDNKAEDKNKEVEQILNRNKNYLLSLGADQEDY